MHNIHTSSCVSRVKANSTIENMRHCVAGIRHAVQIAVVHVSEYGWHWKHREHSRLNSVIRN